MKIKKIEIENFRSIHGRLTLYPDEGLVSFIGANNAGKSNILRAMNLFFNGEVEPGMKFEGKRDICKNSARRVAVISITFQFDAAKDKQFLPYVKNLPEFSDKTVPVTLECTQNGTLRYSIKDAKGRLLGAGQQVKILDPLLAYIHCIYIPAIKDYRTIINTEMMRRIISATFQGWGRGINLSTALGKHKSEFARVIKALQNILDGSGKYVSEIVTSAVPRIRKFDFALPEEFEEFLGRMNFQITEEGLKERISLDGEGSGIQSFTIYSMLRLLYELRPRNTYKKSRFMWLIEEPETFMHHDLQRKTFEKLNEYAADGHIYVTTHSSVFLDKTRFNNSYHVTTNPETKISRITVDNARDVIAGSLGVSINDFMMFNRFNVLVEGETDRELLVGLNQLFREAGRDDVLDLAEVEFIPCGSATSIPHFYGMFNAYSRYASFIALFDRDDAGKKAYDALINRKVARECLVLVPESPYKKNSAMEDIVDKKIWDRIIRELSAKDLAVVKSRDKGKIAEIVGYEYEANQRVDFKRAFTKLLLKHARSKLDCFEKYHELLVELKARCSSAMAKT
ncbi:MAG: AAA family ATPase [Elusimicrobia bacterium]|nr:AAA family ATPase [Elusimicrobiota bacterium]